MQVRTGFAAVFVGAVAGLLSLPIPLSGAMQSAAAAQEQRASLSGTVLDATGRALSGVPIALVDSAAGQRHETRTDAAGRFSVDGLSAGDYRVELSKPGFEQVAGRVVLGPGQQLQRDVVPRIVSLVHRYTVSAKAGSRGSDPNPAASAGPQRAVVRTAAPDDPCKGTTSGGCLTPPIRMVEAWPVFPPALAEKGVSGTVEVKARLGTDGFLTDFRPNDGADPEFAACAVEALRVWEYSPLRLNGVPQECRMTVTFRFEAAKQ
jgi:TonB family protein